MTKLEELIRAIASRIVEWDRQTVPRVCLVVDESALGELVKALRTYNFRVIHIETSILDAEIVRYLSGRILVTNNTLDYIYSAPVYEFGIIALENLSPIDPHKTAHLIHRAVIDYSLGAKHNPFVLYLKDDGHHILADLS